MTTTYGYDSNTGELLSQSYSDGTPTVSYTYTRLGQLKTTADTTGTRTLAYNATDPLQLDSIALPAYFGSRALGRTHDSIHRAAGFTIGSEVTQTYAYHATTGRFNTVTTSSAVQGARTFTYGYNTGGLISSLADGGNFSVSFGYEANRNLLTSIDSKWSASSRTRYDYTYNALGQRQTVTQSSDWTNGAFADYGEAVVRNIGYDDRGELTTAADYRNSISGPNQLTSRNFSHTYDNVGNRLTAGRSGSGGTLDNFTPNVLNQYGSRENNVAYVAGTTATAPAASQIAVTGGTATSTVGQQGRYWGVQTTLANTGGPALANLTITATLVGQGSGGANLVRTETRMAMLAKALQSFTYDFDGNLTGDGVWTYAYDAENRLTAMETEASARDIYLGASNARRLEFQYDYLGRRVQKLVRSGWNGSSYATVLSQRRYLYDGDNLAAELTGDGATVVRSYTWGLDMAGSLTATGGVGALIQITDHTTSQSYLPTYDGNGNLASVIKLSTGAMAVSYEYGPFGEVLRRGAASSTISLDTSIADNPFAFSTKFTDWETGFVYYGARYYSPSLGRFLNRDPIEEAGGLNLYGFAGNDGINHWDVIGYSWLSKQLKSIGNWINKNKQAIITVVASIYVGGLAMNAIYSSTASSIATTTAANIAAGQMGAMTVYANAGVLGGAVAGGTISGTTASVLAGIVGGAAGGAVAGGITTGTLKGALQGAATGAIMGAVQGYYTGANLVVGKPGQAFPWSRVPVQAVAGGLASEVQGGSFRQGFEISGAIAGATKVALWMREKMIVTDKDMRNRAGVSVGINGDEEKVGGGRFDARYPQLYLSDGSINPQHVQFLGGFQGGPGSFFGMPYPPGGFLDHLIEHFAGPHDWLGSWWSYNGAGDNEPIASFFGQHLGTLGSKVMDAVSSVVDIPLAAPFAAAPVVGLAPYAGTAFAPTH